MDSWERVRLEGYGYLTLPAQPGCRTVRVETWRPEGPDNVTRLRRLFIGGTPELSDVRYTHVPSNYNTHPGTLTRRLSLLLGRETVLSCNYRCLSCFDETTAPSPDQKSLLGKFGFRTVSSGTVEVRLNTIHQTMPSYVEDEQRFKRVALKV